MTFRFKRPGLRETVTANRAWAEFASAAVGMEAAPQLTQLPKQRERRTTARHEPRERVNLAAIIQLLRTHPKVAFAWRMQSGLFSDGRRTIKVGVVGIPDILGMLVNGRLFGIEVKAKSGKVSPMQQRRIDQINNGGGLAFVAWSVDDVMRELDNLPALWSNQR